jgi:uncharacterized membrane protein
MKKLITALLILVAIGILFWQQSQQEKQVWFQVIAFLVLFYGIARLSAKIPSKNNEKEEDRE